MKTPGWRAATSLYASRGRYHTLWSSNHADTAVQPAQFDPAVAACYRRCDRACTGSPNRFDCLSACVLSCNSGGGGGGDDVVCNLDPTSCMS